MFSFSGWNFPFILDSFLPFRHNIDSYFSTFLIYFACVFYFQDMTLWLFHPDNWTSSLGRHVSLIFTVSPFCLYLLQIVYTADWEQPTYFTTLCAELTSGKNFIILSIISTDSSPVRAMFPANQLGATSHWGLQDFVVGITCYQLQEFYSTFWDIL